MNIDEAIKMAQAKLECIERETSGKCDLQGSYDCNACPLSYNQGNFGEQKEWLKIAINAMQDKAIKRGGLKHERLG